MAQGWTRQHAGTQAPGAPWQGLTVQARDGAQLGIVVGYFEDGPCAGRLRVHGDAAQFPRHSMSGTAVFAIRRDAVAHHEGESLVLGDTASIARHRWFMHLIQQ